MKNFKRVVSLLFFVSLLLTGGLTAAFAHERGGSCLSAKVISIGDQEVAYYESEGRGETVVLLHGNSMSSYAFKKQLCGPLGKQFHLVAVDLPGHGRSGNAVDPSVTYHLPGYGSVLTSFVETLGLDDAVFVGWSLGGHVLLEAAGQLPAAKGFMILGTPPLAVPPAIGDAFLATNPAAGLSFQNALTNGEVETYVDSLFLPDNHRIPDFFYKDVRRTDPALRSQLLFSVGTLNYSDEVLIAQNMTRPLAVIHGAEDQAVSLEYIRQLALPTLWRGEVQVVEGAGHAVQWEASRVFDRLLRAFIRDIGHCRRSY